MSLIASSGRHGWVHSGAKRRLVAQRLPIMGHACLALICTRLHCIIIRRTYYLPCAAGTLYVLSISFDLREVFQPNTADIDWFYDFSIAYYVRAL